MLYALRVGSHAPDRQLGAGDRFGKYTIVEPIGRGGMAEIYLANLEGASGFVRQVALKRILPEYAQNRAFVELFVQEAKLSSGLQHANIVQVIELGEIDGDYYIAMEFVRGHNLLQVLHQATRLGTMVPLPLALFVIQELCKGLGHAHSATDASGAPLAIVHHDVSPSNVLIGDGGVVKLSDFGVARASIEQGTGDSQRRLRGKLAYMSPEQVSGAPVDRRSDLFAVGIVLYELLTLKRLFRARSGTATMANVTRADVRPRLDRHPDLPPEVRQILLRCLARAPGDRYRSGSQIEEDIARVLMDAGVRVRERDLGDYVRDLFQGKAPAVLPGAEGSGLPWNTSLRPRGGTVGTGTWAEHRAGASEAGFPAALRLGRFVFRLSDEPDFGPVPYSVAMGMIADRAVGPDELVSVNGEPFRRVRDAEALEAAVAAAFPAASGTARHAGRLDIAATVRLATELARRRATGRLELRRDAVIKDLFFVRGRVVHARSNLKRELFGPFMVSSGVIGNVALQTAFGRAGTFGAGIATELVRLGAVRHDQVFRLLEERLVGAFREIFGWLSGSYAFYEDQRPPEGIVPLQLDPLREILPGLREVGRPTAIRRQLLSRAAIVPRRNARPPFPMEDLALPPRERRWVERIEDGAGRNIRGWLDNAAQERDGDAEVLLRVLLLLLETGHLV